MISRRDLIRTAGSAAALTAIMPARGQTPASPPLPAPNAPPGAKGLRRVGYLDIPGGGQVLEDRGRVFIGHVLGEHGTSIVDARDPRRPRVLGRTPPTPRGTHGHKVRVRGDVMFTNLESASYLGRPDDGFLGGIRTWDISDPANPREIHFWKAGASGMVGCGVHRFTIDDRYVYATPTQDGYDGNICMILDYRDPARPVEVGRWHAPGQWVAGGETPPLGHRGQICHLPTRRGDRLYVAYWHAGAYILDISDLSRPKQISRFDLGPNFPAPAHSYLPLPHSVGGRHYALFVEEDAVKLRPGPPPFVSMIDITNERKPELVSTWQAPGLSLTEPTAIVTGAHQTAENFKGSEVPVAYFAQGVRVLDVSNPRAMREIAYYVPEPPAGFPRIAINDVTLDDRGLIYAIDRNRGLFILERTG